MAKDEEAYMYSFNIFCDSFNETEDVEGLQTLLDETLQILADRGVPQDSETLGWLHMYALTYCKREAAATKLERVD